MGDGGSMRRTVTALRRRKNLEWVLLVSKYYVFAREDTNPQV